MRLKMTWRQHSMKGELNQLPTPPATHFLTPSRKEEPPRALQPKPREWIATFPTLVLNQSQRRQVQLFEAPPETNTNQRIKIPASLLMIMVMTPTELIWMS